MRVNKNEKIRRAALLAQQKYKCALCGDHQDTVAGMVYAIEQNAMLCRNCAQFKSVYLFNVKRNCTPDTLIAFLERKPASEPATTLETASISKPKAKKLDSEQLYGLQMLLNGQTDLSLAEWCSRVGVTEADAMQQIADR